MQQNHRQTQGGNGKGSLRGLDNVEAHIPAIYGDVSKHGDFSRHLVIGSRLPASAGRGR